MTAMKQRPRAWENDFYQWNIGLVPETIEVNGKPEPHPAKKCGVFVVHGMGDQEYLDTAAGLRNGFEIALTRIVEWQNGRSKKDTKFTRGSLGDYVNKTKRPIPSPFVYGGYWGDYQNLRRTFPDTWKRFTEREKTFFSKLWKLRLTSAFRSFRWILWEQLKLLSPRVFFKVGPFLWLLYLIMQPVLLVAFLFMLIRSPKILSDYIADVRLYCDPRGDVEKATVQRIDHRVGAQFLQMLGLDWDFRKLDNDKLIKVQNKAIVFDRVVWVSHSLGTVISYNVMSDLLARAGEISRHAKDPSYQDQQEGVRKFRESLKKFITMGSPLDKVSFLFGGKALKPWRKADFEWFMGERDARIKEGIGNWWTNFYHVMDPVSGAIGEKEICEGHPPSNYHIALWGWPGLAHVQYWSDIGVLRFILGRSYGKDSITDRPRKKKPRLLLTVLAMLSYLTFLLLTVGIIYFAILYRAEIWEFMKGQF